MEPKWLHDNKKTGDKYWIYYQGGVDKKTGKIDL